MNGFKLTRADLPRLAKKYPHHTFRWLYQFPLVGVLSHWFFQSLLYLDRTERCFKLSLEVTIAILLVSLLSSILSTPVAWLAAIFIAHTLNFLFNGHPWVALRLYGIVFYSFEEFEQYAHALGLRAKKEPSLQSALVYGSMGCKEWHSASDLDVRLIRKPGCVNGFRACAFLLMERTRASISRFPLDAYVLDSELPLSRMRRNERGIDLLETEFRFILDDSRCPKNGDSPSTIH